MSADATPRDAGPGAGDAPAAAPREEIALFPLRNVLFPGGLLQLRIFEARYLDLMSECLRERRPFGVVALKKGGEARAAPGGDAEVEFERVGTLAELIDVDGVDTGILHVRCRGTRRFELHARALRANGLWVGEATLLPDDALDAAPDAAGAAAVEALREALAALGREGIEPVLAPHRYDSAAWVADRWCELLPFSLDTRQRLLELRDGAGRLALITAFLKKEGVVDA